MLKKAGIVVAAAAAGLLAVSPLAFAGEGHHKGDDKGHHKADHKADHKHYSKTTTYDHSPTERKRIGWLSSHQTVYHYWVSRILLVWIRLSSGDGPSGCNPIGTAF